MITELMEVQKSDITFSKWKEMQNCFNEARYAVDFMQRAYKIYKKDMG